MTKFKILNLALCVMLLVLINTQRSTFAANLNITHVYQETQNWCWAASSQMLLSYYNITKTQTEIVIATKGSAKDEGASEQDIQKILTTNGIPASVTSFLSQAKVNEAADKGKPFVLAWYWTSGGGHALCYAGYEGNQYYIHDPYYGPKVLSYNAVKSADGQGTWKNSICSNKENPPTGIWFENHLPNSKTIFSSITTNGPTVCFELNPKTAVTAGSIEIYNIQGRMMHSIALTPDRSRYVWGGHTRSNGSSNVFVANVNAKGSMGAVHHSVKLNTTK